MAGGGFVDGQRGTRAEFYEYNITWYFIFATIVAALGGSLFGYDLGVSGEFCTILVEWHSARLKCVCLI